MDSTDFYAWLMSHASGGVCDAFDAHLVASVITIAAMEGEGDGAALLHGVGLERRELVSLIGEVFPGARPAFERALPENVVVAREPDEACVRELLGRYRSGGGVSLVLASMVARRALRPNHLWQDLGLRNRRELSWLMERHFERLAAKNARDMKWKKFLYRTICRDGDFGLCTAPSCGECCDYEQCFGREDGESLLVCSAELATTGAVRNPTRCLEVDADAALETGVSTKSVLA